MLRELAAKGAWLGAGAGLAALAAMAAAFLYATGAGAVSIELKDVAPDRIERQRAAVEGRLPLEGTPDLDLFIQRLAVAGVKRGAAMMMRIFKETSELEVWLEKGETFTHFATYPICHWSGTLGPKLREGDKQTPEGFYTITGRQLHHLGRWPRSIDIGFPNAYDQALKRDGSYILMHGGCSSVGCFALTNGVIPEVYGLAQAAIRGGQRYIPIHIFPFRMTNENMAAHAGSQWSAFWVRLKEGYDSFERTRRPPRVSVCKGEYVVEDAPPKLASEATSEPKGRKDRSNLTAGAIRTSCPAPAIVASDGKPGAAPGSIAGAR